MADFFVTIFKISIFLITISKLIHCLQPNGIYIDNGLDKTVIQQVSTLREKRELTRSFSHLFNLPKRSRRSFTNESINHLDSSAAARWIYKVYNLDKEDKNDFEANEIERIKRSDLIMTFTEQYRKQNELWYDLEKTRIPRVKSVIYAEIRVRCTSPSGIASLYEFSWEKDKIFWQLVDTVQVDQAGWIKLNATRIMDRWVQHPKSLQGLKIEGVDVDFEDSEPFIAAYFERSNVLVTKTAKKKKIGFSYPEPNPFKRATEPKSGPCRLHSMYVKFRDLNLDGLIIAPEGYEASFCQGVCRFPLNIQVDTTAHAIVQTLVNFQNPSSATESQCSPHEYEDLNVIVKLNSAGSYQLCRYTNMIVKSCRCN